MLLDCARAQEILWPLHLPRGHGELEESARLHLDSCASCRAFFRRDARLARRLRRLRDAPAPVAGAALRSRVAVLLVADVARPARRRAWVSGVGTAVAAGLLLVAGHLLSERFGASSAPDKFAEDYRRSAVTRVVVPGLDAERVARFYSRELGVRVIPVALDRGYITRAAVCLLDGERGSMVEYDLEGERLAHYRIPLAPGHAADMPGLVMSSAGSVHVVRWSDEAFENALVSEIPASALARLARTRFAAPEPAAPRGP